MIRFEWDEAKARSNQNKHGINFEDAKQIFGDPFALTVLDRVVEEEPRWQTTGVAGGVAVLFVAHTIQEEGMDEVIRIISARRANRQECSRYDENRKNDAF